MSLATEKLNKVEIFTIWCLT